MLKIAEYNTITGEKVELEELEKYGFKPKYNVDTGEFQEMYLEIEINGTIYRPIVISQIEVDEITEIKYHPFEFKWLKPREIHTPKKYWIAEVRKFEAFLIEEMLDTLYDLIKDGLVIKED